MKQLVIKLAGAAAVAAAAAGAMSLEYGERLAVAGAVGIPSIIMMVISRRQLGKSFSVRPEAKALVATGLYSKIRHPMYLFLDLLLVALLIASDRPLLLILWGILFLVQMVQSRREERVLAGAFGEEYERYRARTWF